MCSPRTKYDTHRKVHIKTFKTDLRQKPVKKDLSLTKMSKIHVNASVTKKSRKKDSFFDGPHRTVLAGDSRGPCGRHELVTP